MKLSWKVGAPFAHAPCWTHHVLVGACEGVCACSTCHVILDDDYFDSLEEAEEISEEEEDMLDLAKGLTATYESAT